MSIYEEQLAKWGLWLKRADDRLKQSYSQVAARYRADEISDGEWEHYVVRWKRTNGDEPLNKLSSRDSKLNLNAYGELVIR